MIFQIKFIYWQVKITVILIQFDIPILFCKKFNLKLLTWKIESFWLFKLIGSELCVTGSLMHIFFCQVILLCLVRDLKVCTLGWFHFVYQWKCLASWENGDGSFLEVWCYLLLILFWLILVLYSFHSRKSADSNAL